MNKLKIISLLLISSVFTFSQQPPSPSIIQSRLPKGTVIHGNIPYNNDTLKKHLLDLYLPANAKGLLPLAFAGNIHTWWRMDW